MTTELWIGGSLAVATVALGVLQQTLP